MRSGGMDEIYVQKPNQTKPNSSINSATIIFVASNFFNKLILLSYQRPIYQMKANKISAKSKYIIGAKLTVSAESNYWNAICKHKK